VHDMTCRTAWQYWLPETTLHQENTMETAQTHPFIHNSKRITMLSRNLNPVRETLNNSLHQARWGLNCLFLRKDS
jgi:hypothetical protein